MTFDEIFRLNVLTKLKEMDLGLDELDAFFSKSENTKKGLIFGGIRLGKPPLTIQHAELIAKVIGEQFPFLFVEKLTSNQMLIFRRRLKDEIDVRGLAPAAFDEFAGLPSMATETALSDAPVLKSMAEVFATALGISVREMTTNTPVVRKPIEH